MPVPLHRQIWEALGTSPIGIDYSEVYTSMQTGVIDATEFNLSSINATNLAETARYLTTTGHYFWPQVLSCNAATFDGLAEDLQQVLIEAGQAVIAPAVEYAANQDADLIERLSSSGLEVSEFGDAAALRERLQPVVDEWAGRSPLIADYVAAAREIQ